MVEGGTNPILQEQNHIKDQLAKVVVELIKVYIIQNILAALIPIEQYC